MVFIMKAYKLRFLPLAVTLPIYLVILFLRRVRQLPLERTEGYCAVLVFASVIFLLTLLMIEREKRRKTADAEEPESPKQEQDTSADSTEEERKLLTGHNIPIRFVYLFFSALLPLMGITLLQYGETAFGLILLAGGLLAVLYSVLLLRKYFRRLRALKRMSEEKQSEQDKE